MYFIPLCSRPNVSLLLYTCLALLPLVLHIEEEGRYYLVHVINVPDVQLHAVLTSDLLDNSPKTFQSCKPCPI